MTWPYDLGKIDPHQVTAWEYVTGQAPPRYPMPAIPRFIRWDYWAPDPDRCITGGVVMVISSRYKP